MSDFSWSPLQAPVLKKQPRVLSAGFGDGYEQRSSDGINTIKQHWELRFRNKPSVIDAIDAFLEGKNGVSSFTWTNPFGVEITVVCKSWSVVPGSTYHRDLSATFVQDF